MTETPQLKKCSRCKCNILLETYFSKNRKGQYNKTCDRCRVRCKCPHCEYTCCSNCNLQAHIKQIHSKIKDAKCPTCDYKCSANSTLQRHIKQTHTKIKDCQCPTCDYTCSANSTLTKHIKTCVGNEVGSSGEVKIKKVLNEMKIEYQYNSSHEVKAKGLLRWDFIITNCEEPLFIEFDGRQHYEPQRFGGMSKEQAEKAFEKQKEHDKIKDNYCNDNGLFTIKNTIYRI